MNSKSQSAPAFNCRKRGFKGPNELNELKKQLRKNSNDVEPKRRRESTEYSKIVLPHNITIGQKSQTSREAEMETIQRLLYVKDLGLEIGHHDVFEHFCIFGHLKRVTVRQRTEHYKYATILYTSDTSIELALGANPHNLRGKHYFCHKAGMSRYWPTNCSPNRLTNGISLRQYVYHSSVVAMPDNFKVDQRDEARGKRLSLLLPEASMALLHHLRKEQMPPEPAPVSTQNSPNINCIRLMSSMGENFNFVRHSYTNFVAHKRRPGLYDKLPIDAKISLTAIAYADVRDSRDLISFHYATD